MTRQLACGRRPARAAVGDRPSLTAVALAARRRTAGDLLEDAIELRQRHLETLAGRRAGIGAIAERLHEHGLTDALAHVCLLRPMR